MQSIIITDVHPESFWQRQFREVPTNEQRRFDLLFGAFLPLVCFFFDPFVFTGPGLGNFKAMNYLLAAFSITGLCVWHLYGERMGAANKYLVGLFAVSALAAFVLGVIILPFSLIGLIFLIGALGLSPLVAAFIYARAAIRASRIARTASGWPRILLAAFGTAVTVAVIVINANTYFNGRIEFILKSEPEAALAEANRLRPFAFLMNFDRLAMEGGETMRTQPYRAKALKTAYQLLSRNTQLSMLYY